MKKIKSILIGIFLTSCSINPNIVDYNMIDQDKFNNMNKYRTHILIDLDAQKLYLKKLFSEKMYKISSSSFGIGSQKNSFKTPLGAHVISEKIGKKLPKGAVLKGRVWTNEIAEIISKPIDIEADVITSRILWLEGLEIGRNKGGNVDSKSRYIYIHGTAEEGLIGKPASLGCIRMFNEDVIELFKNVSVGTQVLIYNGK
jgi:hypothetical protein|tara:strand:+ start:4669 stop:5268 length:600 start_codon:yes stop_codon:yes gene_type:complete